MKKKIFALCVVAAIAVMTIAGASLAYLTDTDKKDNVFTVGNVQIALVEQQRGENGLEEFRDNKVLLPLVGSAQGAKDEYGLPTAANYVDKIITVKNTGASNAYIRVYVAIPVALDNIGDAGQNVLHFNQGNKFIADGGKVDGDTLNTDHANWGAEVLVATGVDIAGTSYNVYSRTYNKILGSEKETESAAYVGFYLDSKVDNKLENDKLVYTIGGETINYDFAEGVKIPVYAIGVQADGFADATTALNAAFGADYNPWNN